MAAAAELRVGIVPYSPLGWGMLTGALPAQMSAGDVCSQWPRFSAENARHNAALPAPVSAIADARGTTPAQVALVWVHQRSDVHGVSSCRSRAPAGPSACWRTWLPPS
jgi:aryl-alcohol dehydrogenase-like predicted oxidoreductase